MTVEFGIVVSCLLTGYCVEGSRWPRGLSRGSAAARLLRLWVRVPPSGAWMSVSCVCCMLSGSGLCVGPIARAE
jgi:hypothetical protein